MLGAFGVGMNAYNNYYQAEMRKQEAALKADSLTSGAAMKQLEAAEIRKQGELAQAENRISGRASRAKRKVTYAASGVKVNEGTPVDVLADMAAWNEYERQKIAYNTDLTSWGLDYEAAQLRQEAANVRAGASSSYANSLSNSIFSAGYQFFNLAQNNRK